MAQALSSTPPASRIVRRSIRVLLIIASLMFATALQAQQPRIALQTPMGGENWILDTTYSIRWTTIGTVTGTLSVELSRDSGATWSMIDTVTARAGQDSLRWTVEGDTTHTAFIRVRTADSAISGRTRRTFSIVAEPVKVLRLLTPNGGETITPGSMATIRWISQYVTGDLVVEYTLDSGSAWIPIQTVPARTGLDSLLWTAPTDTTRRAIVQIRAADGSISDMSNRVFSIMVILPVEVTVIAPNGGEVFAPDSMVVIRWEARNVIAGFARPQYSIDTGRSWVNIGQARQARNGVDTVSWRVPNASTDMALVRVMIGTGGGGGGGGNQIGDTSDTFFAIGGTPAPTLSLQTLLGGGTYRADSVTWIRWNSARIEGDLVVEYSTDGRGTWTNIATVHAIAGRDSVQWIVPNEPTTTAWVRVRTVDSTLIAMSTRSFTIIARGATNVRESLAAPVAGGLYPNPASGTTALRWTQPTGANVTLMIVAIDGRVLSTVDAGYRGVGAQELLLDVAALASGRYFIEIASDGAPISRVGVVRR